MSNWTDVLHGVWHWVLQPSPSIAAVFCQRPGRPNSSLQMSTWRNGITSASHAEGPGLKSQCVHFVLHMPSSTRVAPELRARLPAALSCTSPLTQSLQPNVWHGDVGHIVAQTLATTILKCKVWMDLILTDLKNTLAEQSKPVAQSAIPKGRRLEPHRRHFIWFDSSP